MIRYLIRRLMGAVVVIWVVSVVTFAIFQVAPALTHSKPIYYYIARNPPAQGSLQFKLLNHAYGFDRPIVGQYWHWLTNIFHSHTLSDGFGDNEKCFVPCLGYSFKLHSQVSTLIWQAIPVSLSLCVGAALLWLFTGVLVGTISGLRPGSIFDRMGMTGALAAVSLPIFFTGPILLFVFDYQLKWLPNIDYAGPFSDPAQWLRSMVLPWIALALSFAALYARLTRANMMEVMSEDYIRTARAKGLPRRTIVLRHGLRSALTPIATIFGIDVGTLIGSTVITEHVFNLRGLGNLTLQSIQTLDLPIIMGVTVVAAMALVAANVVVDFVYAVLDPRVSYS
jgi:peptide/nickel transport system permease protein